MRSCQAECVPYTVQRRDSAGVGSSFRHGCRARAPIAAAPPSGNIRLTPENHNFTNSPGAQPGLCYCAFSAKHQPRTAPQSCAHSSLDFAKPHPGACAQQSCHLSFSFWLPVWHNNSQISHFLQDVNSYRQKEITPCNAKRLPSKRGWKTAC